MLNKTLERIVQHLIIYSAAIENIGLMNGKMGMALFFIKRVEVYHFLAEYFHFR